MINKPQRSTSDRPPENEYEAIMSAKPFEEPETSTEEKLALREAVTQYVDALEPRDLWIINACISEGKSLQKIADELNITKTHVWRLRNQAFEKLRVAMSTNTTIRKHIQIADTWEQSATQWVMHLASLHNMHNRRVSFDALRNFISALELAHRDPDSDASTQHSFEIIAQMAIEELRFRESWDTGSMISTLCQKQHDYGHGNINRFGLYGVIVRLSDKIERLHNLTTNRKKSWNESTDDTLIDMVGYCVVALMLLDETFNLELGDDYGTSTGHN